MMRFIDCTKAYWTDPDEPTPVFAFLDTTTDTFLVLNGSQIWHRTAEFMHDLAMSGRKDEVSRFMNLIPPEIK